MKYVTYYNSIIGGLSDVDVHPDAAMQTNNKLREALIGLRDRISMFYKNEWIPYDEWEGAYDDANSALAAPPRNCDKYATVKEATEAFARERQDMPHPCPDFTFSRWLLTPVKKEGGAK